MNGNRHDPVYSASFDRLRITVGAAHDVGGLRSNSILGFFDVGTSGWPLCKLRTHLRVQFTEPFGGLFRQ